MKTLKIKNRCGGKKTGCAVEFDLPSGITPHKVTDKGVSQGEAGTKSTSTK